MMLNDLKLRFKSFSFSATPKFALLKSEAAQAALEVKPNHRWQDHVGAFSDRSP